MNLELLFSTFIFSNCLKEMLTFLTISELLRMSVYQGWCCSKSIVVLFPQYLPICSEIGSQVENRKKWKVFEKPAILTLIMLQHLQQQKMCGFPRQSWWAKSVLNCFWLYWRKKHLKLQNVYNIWMIICFLQFEFVGKIAQILLSWKNCTFHKNKADH